MSGPPPKPFHPLKTAFVGSVLILAFVWAYFIREPPRPRDPVIQGSTMGTSYAIRLSGQPLSLEELRALREAVTDRLEAISQAMSTYIPDSEISAFNRAAGMEPMDLSDDFARVLRSALDLAGRTGGAFDPTLDPLLNLWGFGHEAAPDELPSDEVIEEVRARFGYALIALDEGNRARKLHPEVQVNLNAIAKGFGSDALAELLRARGLEHFFVEVGGEVLVLGLSPRGEPWRVGIEQPLRGERSEKPYAIAQLSRGAVATSGDYRNFRETESGELLVHILDPRSGRPGTHALASVTVLADSCMEADAVATALYAMGPDEGLGWTNAQPDFEALFIVRQPDGRLAPRVSDRFAERATLTLLE